MPRSRLLIAVALLSGCAALLLLQNRKLADTRAELLRARENDHATTAKLLALETRAGELAARLAATERDNSALRTKVESAAAATTTARLQPPPRISHAQVDARYNRARQLAKAGNHSEALADFLWCYDEGMPRVAAFAGVRGSFLLGEIARLGEKYPAALDALRARRDQLLDAIISDPDDSAAFHDFSSLNHALQEDAQNLALFEKLPPGDERRGQLGLQVYETLAQSKRYAEALEAHSYRSMRSLFDTLTAEREFPSTDEARAARIRQMSRASALSTAAKNFEVLVGAGQLDQAREFAAKVLAYDTADATRQSLREAAARAGRPDFAIP